MGCGHEISDWDDKAVQDSMAGKNTELDPEIAKEAEAHHAIRVELEEKTANFEKSGVVENGDMIRAIADVPLAREVAKGLGIHSITFSEELFTKEGTRAQGLSIMDAMGAHICIGPNMNEPEYQRTLFHEVGELYYKHELPDEKAKDWIEMRIEAKHLTLREEADDDEKKNDNEKGQHHFAERFADYCMAQLDKDPIEKESAMNDFKNFLPDEAKALDNLLDELRER